MRKKREAKGNREKDIGIRGTDVGRQVLKSDCCKHFQKKEDVKKQMEDEGNKDNKMKRN